MKKRVLAILLALAMIAVLLPAVALAEEVTDASGLKDAIANATTGPTTITLKNDLELTESIVVGSADSERKTIILDLGGHTLSSSKYLLDIYNADVTIQNGTIATSVTNGAAIWCNTDAALTITETATVTVIDGSYGIGIWSGTSNADITINGTLSGGNGLTINGNITNGTNTVTIGSTAKINVTGYGLYLAGNGKTTIENGSSITGGSTGIEIRAGELTVNGGTITGNGSFTTKPNSGGTTTSGAGIAVVQHTTGQQINVVINNGNISGHYALFEADTQNMDPAEDITLNVSGGSFIATNPAGQAISSEDVTGFVSSGTFSTDVSQYVAGTIPLAQVNNGSYIAGAGNIQAAVASAPYGSTVTVLKGNVSLNDVDVGTTVINRGGTVMVNAAPCSPAAAIPLSAITRPPSSSPSRRPPRQPRAAWRASRSRPSTPTTPGTPTTFPSAG